MDHLDATRARARAAAAAAQPGPARPEPVPVRVGVGVGVGVAWRGEARQAGGRRRASGRAGEAFIFETDELIGIDWRSFW